MSIVVFQHHPLETSAVLGNTLLGVGHDLRTVELFAGDPVPPDLNDVDGIVSMGGPMNVADTAEHAWIEAELAYLKAAHEASVPVVGVCLGAQLIAAALGGEVGPMTAPEIGFANVRLAFPGTIDTVMSGLPWDSMQAHMHGQEVKKLPDGAALLASSKACKVQAFKVGLTTYAFQYHFEWQRKQLDLIPKDSMSRAAGYTEATLQAEAAEHYDMYRHLGDRLCSNIALYLMPIDRR